MELLELIRDLHKEYELEFMILVFIIFCFYFNYKNQQNFEKLLLKKEELRNRYYDEKYKLKNPSDVELMFGDLDDVETDKEFEKRFDRFFKNTQAEFDSKTLLNIETMLFVLLMLIVLITVYTFKIIYNG
jgi:hypothetical protein